MCLGGPPVKSTPIKEIFVIQLIIKQAPSKVSKDLVHQSADWMIFLCECDMVRNLTVNEL